MRMLLALAVLIVAAAGVLVFTEPGQGVLRAFGVPAPECMSARWLNTVGYHVPQCTCGNCTSPPLPPIPEPPGAR
ncbi:MAG: hypothetical protein ABSB77_19915 [Xanthobacteraceae bacterium]